MPQQPYRAELAGWGRFPVVDGLEWKSEDLAAISAEATLCRGLGRSYGDSSLPAGPDRPVANATLANRLLRFDPSSGVLRAEAGASLLQLNRVFLRRGWFTPVSPGIGFVYSDYKAPLSPGAGNQTLSALKVGKAKIRFLSLLWYPVIAAWDDATIEAAAKNGGITNVEYAEYEFMQVLGTYGEYVVTVYGN